MQGFLNSFVKVVMCNDAKIDPREPRHEVGSEVDVVRLHVGMMSMRLAVCLDTVESL